MLEEQAVSTYYPADVIGNPGCPLDEFFGFVVEARWVDHAERHNKPASLTELTSATAPLVKRYMSIAKDGLAIAQVAHQLLPILWVLDSEGRIHIALEEVYQGDVRKFPLARGMKPPAGFFKLGHPYLLDGKNKQARIAGELLYDPDPEFGVDAWVITNSSGRFGYGAHRKEKHLRNVADAFESFGIEVDIYYIPPET